MALSPSRDAAAALNGTLRHEPTHKLNQPLPPLDFTEPATSGRTVIGPERDGAGPGEDAPSLRDGDARPRTAVAASGLDRTGAGHDRDGAGLGHVATGRKAAARLVPGVGLAAAGVAVAVVLNAFVSAVGVLTGAVLLGVLAANVGVVTPLFAPGIQFTAKKILRIGVALLGLRLAVSDVLGLGPAVLAVIVTVVVVTFVGTVRLGRWLNAGEGTTLLVATGFSICGASAVAAMNGVAEQDEEDVAKALGLVTLCGSLAMLVLPALQPFTGLSNLAYGIWAGASVHEVAQVVAAAAPVTGALAIAVAVKLTRVVLLAPMLAAVSFVQRRKASAAQRPPLLPLFVGVFLLMIGIRSTGLVPANVLTVVNTIDGYLLAAALFALGTAVRLRTLRRAGLPAALLGLLSTALIAGLAYLGAVLVT